MNYKTMVKKLFIAAVILSVLFLGFAWWKIQHNPSEQTTENEQPTQQQSEVVENSNPEKPQLVVSETELAKLKAEGVVSPDEKYYIQTLSKGFPKIVDLATGDKYNFKPGANYTQVSKVSWSADGKTLAYVFQLPDAMYLNNDILNTVTLDEVINQNFPNAGRILVSADKINYVWLNNTKILFTELLQYSQQKKYFANTTVGTYDINTEVFEHPWNPIYVPNVYSIEIAPTKNKFLYVEAILDQYGSTTGREYNVADINGKVLKSTTAYNEDWYK